MPSPTTSSNTTTFSLSSNNLINALLTYNYNSFGGGKWGGPLGTGVTLSYSFPTQWTSSYWDVNYAYNEPYASASAFNNLHKQATISALSKWSAVANISFVETVETPSNVGDFRFAFSSEVGIGIWGWSYLPNEFSPEAADVWVNPSLAFDPDWAEGGYNYFAMLHEIGHGLGLKHPGNYNAGGGGSPPPYLPSALDSTQYSIMSYNDYRNTDPLTNLDIQPITPMVLDIQAIQYMYGANMSTNAGNNSYQFDIQDPFYMTIWDAGGLDEINLSNWTNSSVINLTPGAYSSIRYRDDNANTNFYTGENNLGIAYNSYIENAIGGSGNDTLIGNDRANLLNGGNGNDTIDAGSGNDTVEGGNGIDVLVMNCFRSQCSAVISGNGYILTSVLGEDRISSIEQIRFLDATVAPSALLPFDDIPPTIQINSTSTFLKLGQSATINFQLSERSPDFSLSDVTVLGGQLSGLVKISDFLYTALFSPNANIQGNASMQVAAGRFNDDSANLNLASNTLTIALDTLPPNVTLDADKSLLKIGENTVTLTFNLSEASSDFQLDDILVSGAELSNFTGSASSYSAQLTMLDDASSASVQVAAQSFSDPNGNLNVAASSPLLIVKDSTPPRLSSSNPANLASRVSVNGNLQLDFDEAVRLGSGQILIKTADQKIYDTILLTQENIQISDDIVMIQPNRPFNSGAFYSVEFAADNFTDIAGNPWTIIPTLGFSTNFQAKSANKTISLFEDSFVDLSAADFAFSDADSADRLASILISQLPTQGQLLYADQAVQLNQQIALQQLLDGGLRFIPAADGFGASYSQFSFKVSDGIDYSAESNRILFNVIGQNDIPSLVNPIADQAIDEGQLFALNLAEYFVDPDGIRDLTFRISLSNGAKLPKWLTFNRLTGLLSGRPNDADTGMLAITISATDPSNTNLRDSFDLAIANINQAPRAQVSSLSSRKVDEGKNFSYTLSKTLFTDPDRGDRLTYSASLEDGQALPTWLKFNATTRVLSGKARFDSADDSPLLVRFTATDKLGATNSVLMPINVNNIATIRGSAKADNIKSGEGVDRISTGLGADRVDAGPGADIIDLGRDRSKDTLVLNQQSANDSVRNFVNGIDVVQFSDFVHRDQDSNTLLLSRQVSGLAAQQVDAQDELLLISNASLDAADQLLQLINLSFEFAPMSSGKLMFAVQVNQGVLAGRSLLGYVDVAGNDILPEQAADAISVELLATIQGSVDQSSFWLASIS